MLIPDLVPAAGLGGLRRLHRHRHAHQRSRRPGADRGLVLIVMLIGFTIMQNAFAGGGLGSGSVSDSGRKALALTGCGDIIFDWDVPADRIYVSPEVEAQLGLARGTLEGPAAGWLDVLHPFERDRYRACLDTMLEQRRGPHQSGVPAARRRRPLLLVRDARAPPWSGRTARSSASSARSRT